jgi:hypothetical protein
MGMITAFTTGITCARYVHVRKIARSMERSK